MLKQRREFAEYFYRCSAAESHQLWIAHNFSQSFQKGPNRQVTSIKVHDRRLRIPTQSSSNFLASKKPNEHFIATQQLLLRLLKPLGQLQFIALQHPNHITQLRRKAGQAARSVAFIDFAKQQRALASKCNPKHKYQQRDVQMRLRKGPGVGGRAYLEVSREEEPS